MSMAWRGNGLKGDDYAENNFINKIKGFFMLLSLCFYNTLNTAPTTQCIRPLFCIYLYSIESFYNGRYYMSHKHQVWLIFIASDSIQFVSRIENQIENWKLCPILQRPMHTYTYTGYIYIYIYSSMEIPLKRI